MRKTNDQLVAEIENRLHYAGRAIITAQRWAEQMNDSHLVDELDAAYVAVSKASDSAARLWPRYSASARDCA